MPFTFEYHELIIGNILVLKENQNAEDPFFFAWDLKEGKLFIEKC